MPVSDTRSGATTRIVSEVNSTAILEALQSSGPMTLQQIGGATGLSPATVNRIIDRLGKDRLVIDVGVATSSGGRPPRLIGYNSRRHSVIAIDIGARKISGGVFDLQGRRLHTDVTTTVPGDDPAASSQVFEQVTVLIARLVARAERLNCPAQTVGVGVPGTVRTDTGIVQFAPSVHWWDLPLASLLTERIGLPVVVENDVNLIAVAEHKLGAARNSSNAVTIAIGTGVGAGLILNGRLYRGAHGGSGEVGYMLMDVGSLAQPWPGFGDLESRISGRTMVEQTREALGLDETALTHPRELVELVRSGNETAAAILRSTIDYVAMAVANISTVLNPEIVVVAGGAGSDLAELAIPMITARLQGRIPLVPRVVAAEVEDVELVGASLVAIEQSRDFRYVTNRQG